MCKWLRCLVCLLVICALLINLSPLRVMATGAGLAGVIASASSVTVSAPLVVGASLIALGVMANNTNPLVFENVVNDAVDSLSAAGQWVADGTVELLRTVDEAGNAMYYAAGEMLEGLRSWLFDEGEVLSTDTNCLSYNGNTYSFSSSASFKFASNPYTISSGLPVSIYSVVLYIESSDRPYYPYCFAVTSPPSDSLKYNLWSSSLTSYPVVSNSSFSIFALSSWSSHKNLDSYYTDCSGMNDLGVVSGFESSTDFYKHFLGAASLADGISSSLDLSLGQISTVPIDGTSALDWAPEYQANRLKVIEGGNDPDPDSQPPNDGKWFWPIMLPLTAATLYTMSQADEWSGQTPQEFDDYSTNTEFEILDRPEFDGYKGIELAPITNPNPNPNPNPGTNPDPDTGGDTDPTAPGEPNPDPDPEPDPDPDPNPDPDPEPDPDPDGGDSSGDGSGGSWKPPSDHTLFALADLSKFFPFCIPFDLYDFFTLLNAEPVAPVLSWEIKDLAGQTYSLDVDLSQWDSVALLFRRLQLFLFITGLAAASRKFIKW